MELSEGTRQTPAGGPMPTAEQTYLRTELERRQQRLRATLHSPSVDPSISLLLAEVDAALSRMGGGTYGLCETCHDPIERDRLLADPLVKFCLDDLTGEERRALEHDLALAARIQRGLLPVKRFAHAGWQVSYHYEPARVVSGDYCDFFPPNNALLFLCGDVSGKGVAASMLMSHLHATFRSLADAGLSLDRMVEAANRIFVESTLAGQFATLVVGRASQEGSVEIVSAGHLPILHLSADGADLEYATGVPLGMFSSARFPKRTLVLRPGDTLLVYTDGLTEARDSRGDEYGMERLKTFASRYRDADPDGLIAACLKDLRQFTAADKQTDDLTMLVIRRSS